MLVSVRKGDEFCFYRWTIARAYRLNLSIVEWGIGQTTFKDLMYLRVGVHRPTGQLFQGSALIHITELVGPCFSWLYLQILEMNATFVDTYRGARLHSGCADPMTGDAFRQMGHSRFCNPATSDHLPTNVHQSIEESACCQNHTLSIDLCAPNGSYANGLFCLLLCHSNRFYHQFVSLILPDIEVGGCIEVSAPLPDELSSVALGSWRPNGRSLAHVQHPELYGGSVSQQSHLSA